MQTKLPPIKFLLDSPIDNGHGNSYGNTHSYSTPMSTINASNGSTYHQPLPSIPPQSNNPDAQHLAAINAHNKQVMHLSNLTSHNPHPSNIKSLLSPPESPDMGSSYQQSSFDPYVAQQVSRDEERYNIPQASEQQCSCCANKSYSMMNSYDQQPILSNYNPYIQQVQRYHSFPSTLQPNPTSHYDRKSTISAHSLPRLNTSILGMPTPKIYTHKSFSVQLSPNDSSSGNRYQCPYCSKRFSRPSSLRIHTYSHTGEKPFVCTEPGCGRKFSVQSNMRRHLRVHRLGRPVKKTRYDGEVEGVKILNPASMLRSY
ncbi:5765_t:CDS:2 [Funneliformis geosporum]|uniref:2901_t:CDS:1 n=1 Tax=Funneliformis geosporum TaxID=1117311 RepID=A0A9W4SN85_9GLOM|nr:5765_t:CDS:2 [Funneliformis geosporum]CAI2175311.1 2901_t:CDS:2 [Funneliformis geosporum]